MIISPKALDEHRDLLKESKYSIGYHEWFKEESRQNVDYTLH